jgi:hypothetical protein
MKFLRGFMKVSLIARRRVAGGGRERMFSTILEKF